MVMRKGPGVGGNRGTWDGGAMLGELAGCWEGWRDVGFVRVLDTVVQLGVERHA